MTWQLLTSTLHCKRMARTRSPIVVEEVHIFLAESWFWHLLISTLRWRVTRTVP